METDINKTLLDHLNANKNITVIAAWIFVRTFNRYKTESNHAMTGQWIYPINSKTMLHTYMLFSFAKAIDSVVHNKLLTKLISYDIDRFLLG